MPTWDYRVLSWKQRMEKKFPEITPRIFPSKASHQPLVFTASVGTTPSLCIVVPFITSDNARIPERRITKSCPALISSPQPKPEACACLWEKGEIRPSRSLTILMFSSCRNPSFYSHLHPMCFFFSTCSLVPFLTQPRTSKSPFCCASGVQINASEG